MKSDCYFLVCISIFMLFFSQQSFAIKKCKDADGNWHYGDVAVTECENSKVTTLNNRGFITGQEEAPKTEEELLVEQQKIEAEQAEKKRILQEREERLRILSIYETEDDIDRQRDNQVSSVEGNIAVHKAYLKSMDVRVERLKQQHTETKGKRQKEKLQTEIDQATARIEKSKKELAGLEEQKTNIIEKFKKEKELYLLLKSTS